MLGAVLSVSQQRNNISPYKLQLQTENHRYPHTSSTPHSLPKHPGIGSVLLLGFQPKTSRTIDLYCSQPLHLH